jgi:hypothetical protein
VVELFFLSLNNWGLNFLQNKCSQSSQIYLSAEKLRKVFTLQSCKFLNDKIDQNINFAKLPSAKYFLYSLQFYYPSHSFGKEDILWYFFYLNCSDLLWEKNVLVIEKNFWNSRLKAENLQNVSDHLNNLFKQWKVRTTFGNRMLF